MWMPTVATNRADPRFTSYRDWLSSDCSARLRSRADAERLGDGFYEQKLVREQIGELTGAAATREEQYRALLEAGATVASEWGLRPA